MPEGDTIYRAARALAAALKGRRVTRFESVFPALMRVDRDRPIAGRTIESIESRGKHLLFFFSGDLILRTHMRMHGAWHVYPPTVRWRRRALDMRIVIATELAVAVGFTIPVAEFLTTRDLQRHPALAALGPDLAAEDFDRATAVGRMRACGDVAVGDALLDQRVMAGVGNVFKSEVLFIARVDPFALVSGLDDSTIERIVDTARKHLRLNVAERSATLAAARGRRTTNSLHPEKRLWVYQRSGRPCRKCGAIIQFRKTGALARGTYWCPACQARSTETTTGSARSELL